MSRVNQTKKMMLGFIQDHIGETVCQGQPKVMDVCNEVIEVFGWAHPGDTIMACVGIINKLLPDFDTKPMVAKWFAKR